MKPTNDPWLWLMREGHRLLKGVQLPVAGPLKVDGRRDRFSAVQQAMLEEQLRFRRRSRDRFPDPEQWLWTDRSLQQASDWSSATFKADLIDRDIDVVDACCGAGADLVALAQNHRVLGIDCDARMVLLARANLRAHQRSADFCVGMVPDSLGDLSRAALHIDPDRRVGQDRMSRTTHGEAFRPTLDQCMRLAERARAAIIKLAPATILDNSETSSHWRRCWLGTQRECPQQLLLGGETRLSVPGGQVAAALCASMQQPGGSGLATVYCGEQDTPCDVVSEPGGFVYEPHPALYAAGLAPSWAREQRLSAITQPRGYYTGDRLTATDWAQEFRVLDLIAWDDRRVRKWLRAHDVGTLEVKSRLVTLDASEIQRRYSQAQGRPMVCLLTRVGKGLRAIMAERTSA